VTIVKKDLGLLNRAALMEHFLTNCRALLNLRFQRKMDSANYKGQEQRLLRKESARLRTYLMKKQQSGDI